MQWAGSRPSSPRGLTPRSRSITRGICTRNRLTHGAHHPTGNTSFLAFSSLCHTHFSITAEPES
nr:MAG TPA: hypothetical protein [Caudoviricetes sp.]